MTTPHPLFDRTSPVDAQESKRLSAFNLAGPSARTSILIRSERAFALKLLAKFDREGVSTLLNTLLLRSGIPRIIEPIIYRGVQLMWDRRTAALIAACFAESVIHLFESLYPDDTRPREAIKAAFTTARRESHPAQTPEAPPLWDGYVAYAARAVRAARVRAALSSLHSPDDERQDRTRLYSADAALCAADAAHYSFLAAASGRGAPYAYSASFYAACAADAAQTALSRFYSDSTSDRFIACALGREWRRKLLVDALLGAELTLKDPS